jgi:hypothetical protein
VVLLLLLSAGSAFAAYSGSFTVGPGGDPRFPNPYAAGESLRLYGGMSGNVTFNIVAGSYTLPNYVNLSNIVGASSYTMTWKPQNPGDIVNITYNSSYVFYTYYTNNVKFYDLNIFNSSNYGIYCDYYSSGIKIEHCTFRTVQGVYFYYYCNDDSLIRNDIKVTSSYGVYDYNGGYSYRHVYINNLIYGWTSYGIYMYYSYYNKLFYNTIVGTGSYAMYQYYCYNDTLRNNILQANSYAWYRMYGSTLPDSSNYNCFWLNNGSPSSLVIYNSSYGSMTLATWRAYGRDSRSLQYNPLTAFPSNARLRTGSPCIDSGNAPYASPPIAACTLDVDGTRRPYGTRPDIGAYEWAGATAMNGTYHIKPGVTRADTFPTFAASLGAVALRGLSGNVTFHVMAGTYSEGQLDFSNPGNGAYRVVWMPDAPGVKPVYDAGGASYAIYAPLGCRRLHWEGLTVQNFTSYGFYLYVNTGVSPYFTPDSNAIVGNTINGPNGIYLYAYYGASDDSILGNKINATSSYGIYAYGSTMYYAYRNIFANNMITGWTSYGIYCYGYFYYPKFYYNTIQGTGSYALYQYYNYYDSLRSNILQANSYAWYRYYGSNPPDYSNYNCFWLNGGSTGSAVIYNSNYGGGTLAWWRGLGHGKDANSIQWDPKTGYPLNPHLRTASPCRDSGGPAVTGYGTDIDGDARPYSTACDIGADEYTTLAAAMSGVYTVKQAGGGDYYSIIEGMGDVALRGFAGDVQFDVYNGTYTGKHSFEGIGNGANRLIIRGYPGQTATISAGANYGFYLYSNQRIHLENLTVSNYTSYGIYTASYYSNLNTNDSCAVKFCTFTGPASGIYWNYGNADDTFWGNKIYTTSSYGIYLYSYSGSMGARNVIANNFIWGSPSYGLYTQYQSGLRMLYNSVYTTSSYGWYDYYSYGAPSFIPQVRKNNIFVAGSYAWYCYYFNGTNGFPDTSNCNDYRLTGGGTNPIYFGYSGTSYTVPGWIAYSQRDSQSFNADPQFVSTTNLHIQGTSPCVAAGRPAQGVTTDIDGENRSPSAPCVGADEYATDFACRAVFAPTGLLMPGSSQTPSAAFKYVSGPGAATWKGFFKLVRKTGGVEVYRDSSTLRTANIGDSVVVNFANWTLPTAWSDTVYATAWVRGGGDGTPANDSARNTCKVGTVDMQVTSIIAPTGNVPGGSTVYPTVRIRNGGDFNGSVYVCFQINSAFDGEPAPGTDEAGIATVSGSEKTVGLRSAQSGSPRAGTDALVYDENRIISVLAAGRDTSFRFSTGWLANPAGTYTTRCTISTVMQPDMNQGNDTLRGSFIVGVTSHDIGVTRLIAPSGILDSGATRVPACSVYNYGSYTENVISVRMKIGTLYNQNWLIPTLAPGARAYLTFPTWTALERGNLAVSCSTELDADDNQANDKATGTVTVNVHDGAALGIVTPGSAIPPITVTPQARVGNVGTQREPVTVVFKILGATPYTSNPISLAGGMPADTVLDFAPTWTATAGDWTAKCSVYQAGDQRWSNNVLSQPFQVGTVDAAALSISEPVGSVESTLVVIPTAMVKNNGTIPATFVATFTISPSGYASTKTVSLLGPGLTAAVDFDTWPQPHANGSYITRCSTYIAYDANRANDTVRGTFTVSHTADTGWVRRADLPAGPKGKNVKDGGCLAYDEQDDTLDGSRGYIYALKGNGRCEYYRYYTTNNTWAAKESIPFIGSLGKKKGVKKGATMATANSMQFAAKGNGTLEWWRYDPQTPAPTYRWKEMLGVPAGSKACKEGCGAATVTVDDSVFVYFLKGSGTQEWYRYNVGTNTWASKASAPLGASGKTYKNGSAVAASEDGKLIYVIKGSYNELYAYSVDSNKWTSLTSLPMTGSSGKKKKVKDGAGLAYHNGIVYALKGGGTSEFWKYIEDSNKWRQMVDIPAGTGKPVKGGGALVFAAKQTPGLYAFKGNNTLDFFRYGLASDDVFGLGFAPTANAQSRDLGLTGCRLAVAPNPFTSATTIRYTLPRAGTASLKLYDVTGTLVTVLAAGEHAAGNYTLPLAFSSLSRGIYVLRLDAANYTTTQKLVIE